MKPHRSSITAGVLLAVLACDQSRVAEPEPTASPYASVATGLRLEDVDANTDIAADTTLLLQDTLRIRLAAGRTGNGPANNPNVTWTTSDAGVVAIEPTQGMVVAVARSVGTSTVSALVGNARASVVIHVVSAATAYRVTPETTTPAAGSAVSVVAQLIDAGGAAVPEAGRVVTWSTTNGGSLASATTTTDASGAASVSFEVAATLGTTHVITATDAAGLTGTSEPLVTRAGPAASVVVHAGDGQNAAAGATLPVAPAVLVRDAFGHPVDNVAVAFAATAGGGSVAGGSVTTGADGVATAGSWTLGPVGGTNTLAATVDGLPPVTFTAEGAPVSFNMFVESVHLNQANQSPNGAAGVVAGRPGLLRVVVRANEANNHAPSVRVRLSSGGTLVREAVIAAPGTGVPVDPSLGVLSDTWNLALDAADVVQGLGVEVSVGLDHNIPESTRDDNRFPAAGGPLDLDAQPLPPVRITFVPVHNESDGTIGNVTDDNVESRYMRETRLWNPTNFVVRVREPYITTAADIYELAREIGLLRRLEGASGEYYHGIVGGEPGGTVGIAAVGGRVAITLGDILSPGTVVAHELGHNMGRLHSDGEDPAYPHPSTTIGFPGYDIFSGEIHASTRVDYMHSIYYPNQHYWTSDYTFGALIDYQRADALSAIAAPSLAGASLHGNAAASNAAAQGATQGLLVWGGSSGGELVLDPAFALNAPPSLPVRGGAFQLRGMTEGGAEVFRISFDGDPIADAADPDARHFLFVVPLTDAQIASIAALELAGPGGVVTRRADASRERAERGAAAARVQRGLADRLRVDWDAQAFPMALVRDRATGRVLAFGRGGTVSVQARGRDARDLKIILSDGVRSYRP